MLTLCGVPAFGQLVIDEVDYDQPGSDTTEWIEIRLDWDDLYSLSGVALVLYDADLNGNCTEYCRVDLSSLVVMGPQQIIVIGAHPNAVLPLCASVNAIRNGASDALVIEDGTTILHSVEYAAGQTSVCNFPFHLTSNVDNDVFDGSLQRCWSFWPFVQESTPGLPNDCSAVTDVPPLPPETWGTIKQVYK